MSDCAVHILLPWVDPLLVAAGLADRDGALCLLSDGGPNGGVSWVGVDPDRVIVEAMSPDRPFEPLTRMGPGAPVVGLVSYDAGARTATGTRDPAAGGWPDLILARYPAILRFDHGRGEVRALGTGRDRAAAASLAGRAEGWIRTTKGIEIPTPPAGEFSPETDDEHYRSAVADVVARIAAGDLFQANIARAWRGLLSPGRDPFEAFVRLTSGAAPYAAFWRIGDRALVSNSPELFLTFDPSDRCVETRPIKGTRARDPDPVIDAARAADLLASDKDRAENLMIVDLMRNDLSRIAVPGTVTVDRLFELESFATVHHLVSTVSARASDGIEAADLLSATFPPGSITGAPKHQAMKVIALHEPPRGPWCGSLFLLDEQTRLTASVLIRTISFWRENERWAFRTLAGAGIVADSDPQSELEETEAKIRAIRSALNGQQLLQPTLSTSRGRR